MTDFQIGDEVLVTGPIEAARGACESPTPGVIVCIQAGNRTGDYGVSFGVKVPNSHSLSGAIDQPFGLWCRAGNLTLTKRDQNASQLYQAIAGVPTGDSTNNIPPESMGSLGELAKYLIDVDSSLATEEEFEQLTSLAAKIRKRIESKNSQLEALFEEVFS